LLGLTREIAAGELAPRVAGHEERGIFPRDVLRTVGRAGLFGLPYPEADGGAGQPYEVYLQVLEILAGLVARDRRGGQRAHAVLLPDLRLRHRTSAEVPARPARR
jgi:alkylation response protein AidB-like acyl-CoA dehydrogenase